MQYDAILQYAATESNELNPQGSPQHIRTESEVGAQSPIITHLHAARLLVPVGKAAEFPFRKFRLLVLC